MRTLTSSAIAAYESGAYVVARMFRFDFGLTYALWDWDEPITPSGSGIATFAAGITFKKGGEHIQMKLDPSSTDLSTPRLILTLRSVPDTALTPDVLGSIYQYPYQNKRVRVFIATLNPATREPYQVIQVYQGLAKSVVTDENWNGSQVISTLQMTVETSQIDVSRLNLSDRNDENQKDTFAGDRFFENVDEVSRIKAWADGVTTT